MRHIPVQQPDGSWAILSRPEVLGDYLHAQRGGSFVRRTLAQALRAAGVPEDAEVAIAVSHFGGGAESWSVYKLSAAVPEGYTEGVHYDRADAVFGSDSRHVRREGDRLVATMRDGAWR